MASFEIRGKVWRHKGEGSWHFVYVNEALSRRIKDATRNKKKAAFQFVRVRASTGKTIWHTSLFPTKDGPYLLAIKADVRHKEGIADGDMVTISCTLQ